MYDYDSDNNFKSYYVDNDERGLLDNKIGEGIKVLEFVGVGINDYD